MRLVDSSHEEVVVGAVLPDFSDIQVDKHACDLGSEIRTDDLVHESVDD